MREAFGDKGRMRLVMALESSDIVFEGVMLQDPGSWNTHLLKCSDVTFRNVKIMNDYYLSNTDGFDPDASRDVLLENSFALCSDDNVAVKTSGNSGLLGDVRRITVRGCVFITKKSSLKVGTETRGKVMEDILFENNDVLEFDRGMAVYVSDGAKVRNLRYVGNRFERVAKDVYYDNGPSDRYKVKGKETGIEFVVKGRNKNSRIGSIEGLVVERCRYEKPFPRESTIKSVPDGKIDARITNLMVGDMLIASSDARHWSGGLYYRQSDSDGAQQLSSLLASYPDLESWTGRKAAVKQNIIDVLGISSFPRGEMKSIRNGRRDYGRYCVENMALEVLPGVWVCGSLYMPARADGKIPFMLSPHGHFYNKKDHSIPNERGRYRPDQQLRCATLAMMGVAVFSYDMWAWGESALAFDRREHRSGLGIIMQTWQSVRILDWASSQDWVDTARIGVTGASGGGTQTMIIAAIDDRISLSVPVVMCSSHFYGGCPCESSMPIHFVPGQQRSNNAELAAMFAPKPQLIVSDGNDWTASVPEIEMPYLRSVYGLYGASGRVQNAHFAKEKHDYGPSKRNAMYDFVASEWGLARTGEEACVVEEAEKMYVFSGTLPEGTLTGADNLRKMIKQYE